MTKIAHLGSRTVLRATGPDARSFLQGLITNDVGLLSPERPLWAGLLTPTGKYLFDMILFEEAPDSVLLDVEAARADDLLRRLTIYRLRRQVTLERTDRLVLAAWGGAAEGTSDPRLAALGVRWVAASAEGANATPDEYDLHRLQLGVPDGSRDMMVERLLWLEANAEELNGVSFTKGCFVGQENTARMHHRDKVRRRLLPVELEEEPAADRGAGPLEIMGEKRAAGELRSVNGRLGIAYLRLEQIGEALTLGGAPVRVIWPGWLADAPLEAVGDA
jgi:folate-binding protein YgfZ